jgi:trehalose 6-phosphate phosphatase
VAAPSPSPRVAAALDVLTPWVQHPSTAGLFSDFDGTLAPIVDDPSTSAALPGAAEALDGLAHHLGRVGVVSGRSVDALAPHFPPAVALSGLYGLQRLVGGRRADHPEAVRWAPLVAETVARACAELPAGVRVEDKQLSLTLHYREHPETAPTVEAWATGEATRLGLVAHPARMSVELHPPIEADKGAAVVELASGLGAVCFVGDDVGDLPAFEALDRLRAEGRTVVKVAVSSSEQDPRVRAAADVELDGPGEVLGVLVALLARIESRARSGSAGG